ncbi:unnamed protein product [Bubo scandiacus]
MPALAGFLLGVFGLYWNQPQGEGWVLSQPNTTASPENPFSTCLVEIPSSRCSVTWLPSVKMDVQDRSSMFDCWTPAPARFGSPSHISGSLFVVPTSSITSCNIQLSPQIISPPRLNVLEAHTESLSKNNPTSGLAFSQGRSNPHCLPQPLPCVYYRDLISSHRRLTDPLVLISQVASAKFVSQCFHPPLSNALNIVFNSPLDLSIFPDACGSRSSDDVRDRLVSASCLSSVIPSSDPFAEGPASSSSFSSLINRGYEPVVLLVHCFYFTTGAISAVVTAPRWAPKKTHCLCSTSVPSVKPEVTEPKCQPWEKVQQSQCVCKMPYKCG